MQEVSKTLVGTILSLALGEYPGRFVTLGRKRLEFFFAAWKSYTSN
jgi:hypothetical protein